MVVGGWFQVFFLFALLALLEFGLLGEGSVEVCGHIRQHCVVRTNLESVNCSDKLGGKHIVFSVVIHHVGFEALFCLS